MAKRIVDPALISVDVGTAVEIAVLKKYGKDMKLGVHVFSTLKAAVAYAYGGDTIELKSGQYRLFNDDLTLAWDDHSYEQIGTAPKIKEVGGPVGRLSADWVLVGPNDFTRAAWYEDTGAEMLRTHQFPSPASGMRTYVARINAIGGFDYPVKVFLFNASIGMQRYAAYKEIGFEGGTAGSGKSVEDNLTEFLMGKYIQLEPKALRFKLEVSELLVYFAKFETYGKVFSVDMGDGKLAKKSSDGGLSDEARLEIKSAVDAPAIILDGGDVNGTGGLFAAGAFHHVDVVGLGFKGLQGCIGLNAAYVMEGKPPVGAWKFPHHWRILNCDFHDTKRFELDSLPLHIYLYKGELVLRYAEAQLAIALFTDNLVHDVLVRECTFTDYGWPKQTKSIPGVLSQVKDFYDVLSLVKAWVIAGMGDVDLQKAIDELPFPKKHVAMDMLEKNNLAGLTTLDVLVPGIQADPKSGTQAWAAYSEWDHLTWHMNLGIYLRGAGIIVDQCVFYNFVQGIPIKVDGYDKLNPAWPKTVRLTNCHFWGGLPAPSLGIPWDKYTDGDPPTGNWHMPWWSGQGAKPVVESQIEFSGLVNIVRTTGANAGPAKTEIMNCTFNLPGRAALGDHRLWPAVRTNATLQGVLNAKGKPVVSYTPGEKLYAHVGTSPLVFSGVTLSVRPVDPPAVKPTASMANYYVEGSATTPAVIAKVLVAQGAISAAIKPAAAAGMSLIDWAEAHVFYWPPPAAAKAPANAIAYHVPVAKPGDPPVWNWLQPDTAGVEEELIKKAQSMMGIVNPGVALWSEWFIDQEPWVANSNKIDWVGVEWGVTKLPNGTTISLKFSGYKAEQPDFMLATTKPWKP